MRSRFNEKLVFSGAVFVMLLLVGIVGSMDYEDELADEQFYCEQVNGGHWPDYKNIAAEVCNDSGKR